MMLRRSYILLILVVLSLAISAHPIGAQTAPPAYLSEFDFNQDCVIDVADVQMVAGHWFNSLPTTPNYDVNNDGVIDILDIQMVAAHWGGHCTQPVPPMVFVSRQIPSQGSVYWGVPKGMPGVGDFSRFQVAEPGKLLVLMPGGDLRTLIDGEHPTPASMNLVDVNSPNVSYDGLRIVFAGLPAGDYNPSPHATPDAWRIYVINWDGTGLQQVTTSDLNYNQMDMSQFGPAAPRFQSQGYDDTDPAWLPDGRIVFSSTRWPSFAQYSGARTTNLYVVNADGSNMHRITSERNGADRPQVDPLTGKIVYSRWWRNYRAGTDNWSTILDPDGGYVMHNGLTTRAGDAAGRPGRLLQNFWQLASINPDGTGLTMFAGRYRDIDLIHAYGGAFEPDGDFIGNYFPMYNMSEAAGFGGIRRYPRGAGAYEPLIGVTWLSLDYVSPANPTSTGIFNGTYASEPDVLDDGRIVFSWAQDINQDYGLYIMDPDGSNPSLLYDNAGTTELRARALRQRPLPPVIPDTVTTFPGPLPPPAAGPYNTDGTFVFDDLNVYFNAPVDVEIMNAPRVGSANIIRFFLDHQRTSLGSFPNLDWPILLSELPVNPDGSVRNLASPANVPLFEQLRSSDGAIPITQGPSSGGSNGAPTQIPRATNGPLAVDGASHVAGMNFGKPGEVQRCVGCHAGHSMIPVPTSAAAAQWTNLAPSADVTVSSTRSADNNTGVIDRRVMTGSVDRYWASSANQYQNQWVKLTFPAPITVRTVRLYNPRFEPGVSDVVVHQATVRLYSDYAGTVQVASQATGELAVGGTDVPFNDVLVRSVKVEITDVSGRLGGYRVASLAEIEVIARGEAAP